MRGAFLSLACLVAAAAAAEGQGCYEFDGPGYSLQVNIGIIIFQTGPTLGVTGYGFSGSNRFTQGGATQTSNDNDAGEIQITYSPGINGVLANTSFSLAVPNADTADVGFWTISLAGPGEVIPGELLPSPQAFPSISAWSGIGKVTDEFGVSHGGPSTYFPITAVGACGAVSPPPTQVSATSPLEDLGNPSELPGGCGCDDPVNLGTGNLYYQLTDYKTAGPNRLEFTRYYNSLGAASGSAFASELGTNWRSNYDRYLRLVSATQVIAERPNGQQVTFTLNGSGWTTDTDIDLALTNSGSNWTLTDHWDNVETYVNSGSSEATLQTIQTRNGYTQTLQYTGSQVGSVTDSFGRKLILAYSNGLLQSVITPDGLILTYGYSSGSAPVLTSVGYSTTPATSQTYMYGNASFPAALTEIVDENGANYESWTYDSQGRVLTGQLGNGADLNTIVYNDTDGSRRVTNALGETDVFKFTTLQGVPKVTEVDRQASAATAAATATYAYDANGYTASHTDFNGNVMTYMNDAHGQPLTINEAAGTPQARTTTVTYLSNFHLPSQIVTPGLTTSFAYDSKGEMLTRTLTDTTTNTTPYATNGQSRTWTYTWSNFLLASTQTPRTDLVGLTKFAYDGTGALISITNALGQTMQIAKHLPGGLPETIVDANGVTGNLTFDARQRLLSVAITTTAGILTTSYSYDAAGNVIGITEPDGSGVSTSYDTAHRLTNTTDLLNQQMQFTLDGLGDRTRTVLVDVNGVTQATHSGVFDALGRMLQDIGGVNQATSYTYDADGNAITVIDPLNHKTQRTFDALNRLSASVDAAGGTMTESYDAHNRPLSAADPNGGTTAYVYDGFGDAIQRASPATGTTVLRYDGDGNVTQRVDARGVVINYTYDALDRVASVTYPGDSAENVTFTYDQAAHGFGIGRLTSVSDAAGTLSLNYDERGNELSETRAHSGATLKTSYTYDAASRVASITYPSGAAVSYARDKMGRVTGVTVKQAGASAGQTVVSSVTYEPFGPVMGLTYGNGIAETRSYDQDYRMTRLLGGSVQSLAYGYDAANNVLSVTDGVTAANSQTLGYDVLNRLTSAAGGYGSLGYGYDANGNRVKENSPTAAAMSNNDGLGAVTGFSYNQAGRLAAATQGSQRLAQYSYDAFGHRLVKQGTVTTIYQFDQQGRLLEESNGQGAALSDYVYLDGRPVATIAQSTGGQVYFLHDDRLGTPQAATDKSQNTVWGASYQPFGGLNPATSQTATLAQDLRLPGQIMDAETGLYANGFRSYGPGWGRYTQSDPIGLAGGFNTYAYADGNPLVYIDPWGLCTVSEAYNAVLSALSQAGTDVSSFLQNQLAIEQNAGFSAYAQWVGQWIEYDAQQAWQQYGPTISELHELYGIYDEVKGALEGKFGGILGTENLLLGQVVGPQPTYTIDQAAHTLTITFPDSRPPITISTSQQ